MDDRQGSEVQQQKGPLLPAGLLLTLAAAVVFPFDRVLAGMVAAGHGIEAISLYLGLTRGVLLEHVVRLGLATPHDRPLRKSGARGWSVLDTMRLVAWRVAGVHPETIGARLGRSANAVRAQGPAPGTAGSGPQNPPETGSRKAGRPRPRLWFCRSVASAGIRRRSVARLAVWSSRRTREHRLFSRDEPRSPRRSTRAEPQIGKEA